MSYFIITSTIGKKSIVEGFYLDSEIDTVMDDLGFITEKHFGRDFFPIEDGSIGFYSQNGDTVLVEEKVVDELRI